MNDRLNSNCDDALEKATRAYRSQSVPDGPPSEFVADVLAALHLAEKAAGRARTVNLKERILAMKLTTKTAIAATVLIAVGGLLSWLGGGTALAFADVAQAFANIRTATCKIRSEAETSRGKVTTSGKLMYLAPSRERSEFSTFRVSASDGSTTTMSGGITILDCQKGVEIALSPETKKATVLNFENLPADRARSRFHQLRTMFSRAQGDKSDRIEPLGQETIDGRETVGFRIREAGFEYKIWAEPGTGLLVRVEVASLLKPKKHLLMSDFRFNLELDESLFSLEVPQGYTASQVRVDASETTAQDLAQMLRVAAEHNDGVLPADLLDMEDTRRRIIKSAMAKHGPGDAPQKQEAMDKAITESSVKVDRGINFLLKLTPAHDWHYAGKDVKLNTPNQPVFWYKPTGKTDYQVIYADLSIKEVAAEDLRKRADQRTPTIKRRVGTE